MPDGDHELADPQLAGISQPGMRQAGARGAQDGQIGVRILADQLRLERGTVAQRQLIGFHGAGDVAVCQGVAVGRDQHPRTDPADADNGRADRVDDGGHRAGVGVEQINVGHHFHGSTQRRGA